MFERLLGLGMLVGVVIRDGFGYGRFDHIIMICGSLLGFSYLFANWWMSKPDERNVRTIVVSILYGIASWGLTFAVLFKLLYLTGSQEMTITSFTFLALVLAVDYGSSLQKSKVLNKWTTWRLGVLATFAVALSLVSEDNRIAVTYRKYPVFLEYYYEHRDEKDFHYIQETYFNEK